MNIVAQALLKPQAYPHPTAPEIELVETHISWIFLTGEFAYKLKKPVDLGFLDFSTLEKRRRFCHEELRLNRRLCPDLYLDVLPVTESAEGIRIGGDGEPLDYVVRMVQFDRNFELDRLLRNDELTAEQIDDAAEVIAAFHASVPQADPASPFGNPEEVIKPMLANFELTGKAARSESERRDIERLRGWTLDEHQRLSEVLAKRKAGGMMRECHGDMHTGNMLIRNGRVMIFDCIEFSPQLSKIDIINDLAFLFMDLQHAGHAELAWRLLNGWLSKTGDYGGLRVLNFYCAYRAMVRVKVTSIRLAQETDEAEKSATLAEHRSYLRLALGYTERPEPLLVLTHGVSGSGKSVISSRLAEAGGFIHLRSDVERKRLFGIGSLERSAGKGLDIYSPEATERTYAAMLEAAKAALSGGYPVIADATFPMKRFRDPFIELAGSMRCQCRILCFSASEDELRRRVRERHATGGDPSEADLAVLEMQMRSTEPFGENEKALCIDVNTEGEVSIESLLRALSR
ncbi:MAG: AAA family ATPase [Chlorobiaceae bacterium]|nr:AAA family ATPase [Chlorobiaceae bacterium]